MHGDIFFFKQLSCVIPRIINYKCNLGVLFLFVFLRSLQSEFKCPAYTFLATPRGVSLLERAMDRNATPLHRSRSVIPVLFEGEGSRLSPWQPQAACGMTA